MSERRIRTIGIIGAMEEEVSGLKENMTEVSTEERAGMTFYRGKLEGKDAVVVCSGIGKSAYLIQRSRNILCIRISHGLN